MKKTCFITLLLIFFVFQLSAQKTPVIKFDFTEFNYGTIKEEDGKVKCKFTFKNVGDDTLRLLAVKAGCGCTTTEWTQNPLAPKKSGYIQVEYDPYNRPGEFSKGITVTTNDPNQSTIGLVIKGNVLPRPKTYQDLFPVQLGNLRLEAAQFNFGNANNTEIRTDTMKIYNEWKQPMTLKFSNLATYIKMKAMPEILKPGKEGLLIISYDVSQRNDFGYMYDRVMISTNDSVMPEKNVNISLNIVEDFSKLTPEQLANAPKISFESTNFDFGTRKQNETINCAYKFTNNGKSDLIIRKVKASCGCTATNPEKTVLKPGETSVINAAFNPAGREGKQYKTITIMCNDPYTSVIMLTIQGTVVKP